LSDYNIITTAEYGSSSIPIAAVSIVLDGKEQKIADLFETSRSEFYLVGFSGKIIFSRKVDGEVRPFSIIARKEIEDTLSERGDPLLKIRDRLFLHNGRIYMMSNVPEGKPIGHFSQGPKFISRLDNFPAVDPALLDRAVMNRSERRLRGTHVGEIYGTGMDKGHKIKIEDPNLEVISLPLAVASFLINTTAFSHRQGVSVT